MTEEKYNTNMVEQNSQATNTDFTKLIASFGALILDKAFLVLLVGAVGYFLGWRFLYTYYGSFGLDASFFRFTPTDVVSAGWRSFLIMAVLIILAVFTYTAGKYILGQLFLSRGWVFTSRMFFLFIILSILLLLIGLNLFYNRWGTYLLKEFFIWSIIILAMFWITHLIGESLYDSVKPNQNNHRLSFKFFKVIFPSPLLWLISISLGFIFLMMFLSSYNAALYARRDKGNDSTLQIASFYVNEKLEIPGGQPIRDNVWMYDNLRFLTNVDDTFFVFRLDEVRNNITTLYGIPVDKVIEFRLQSWWAAKVLP